MHLTVYYCKFQKITMISTNIFINNIFTAVLLFSIILRIRGESFQCSQLGSQFVDGVFPDPESCQSYYHCINGKSYKRFCPPGQQFQFRTSDFQYFACVYQSSSECKQKKFFEDKQSIFCSKEQALQSDCFAVAKECQKQKNITIPDNEDSSIYYHCSNGKAWIQHCPREHYFTPKVDFVKKNVKLCVKKDEAKYAIAGNWSAWSGWSACSPACGTGRKKERKRKCNNPIPLNNGLDCTGQKMEVAKCEEKECKSFTGQAFFVYQDKRKELPINQRYGWTSIGINEGNLYNEASQGISTDRIGVFILSTTYSTVEDSDSFSHISGNIPSEHGQKSIGASRDISTKFFMDRDTAGLRGTMSSYRRAYIEGSPDRKDSSWLAFEYKFGSYCFVYRVFSHDNTGLVPFQYGLTRDFYLTGPKTEVITQSTGYFYVVYGYNSVRTHEVGLIVNSKLVDYTRSMKLKQRPNGINPYTVGSIMKFQNTTRLGIHVFSGTISSGRVQRAIHISALELDSSAVLFFGYKTDNLCTSNLTRIGLKNIEVDNINQWNSNDKEYKITRNGLFYFEIAIPVKERSGLEAYIMVNDKPELGLKQTTLHHAESIRIARTGLLKLKVFDILSIEVKGCIQDDEQPMLFTMFQLSTKN